MQMKQNEMEFCVGGSLNTGIIGISALFRDNVIASFGVTLKEAKELRDQLDLSIAALEK